MPYASTSDAELLNAFCEGDTTAFTRIYERYWNKLYRIARHILEADDLAKDVVQEVFVSFYEKAMDKRIENLHAYLYQSVKFQCFMQLRAGRISEKHLQRVNQLQALNVVEQELEAKELQAILNDGISSLPEKCREVFYLSRVRELSNKQIAEQLHISTKTVEHQITKALKAIRFSLEKLAVFLFLPLS